MNFAHIHLVLNHIPIVGIPVAIIFLAYGLLSKNQPTQKFSLWVLFALAAVVLPVYLTGEPAEDVIESLPGVAEVFIESHEGAAKVSLVFTLVTGLSALGALWFQQNQMKSRLVNTSVLVVACFAVLSLFYTANLGGQVRHTELRSVELRSTDQH